MIINNHIQNDENQPFPFLFLTSLHHIIHLYQNLKKEYFLFLLYHNELCPLYKRLQRMRREKEKEKVTIPFKVG
jgi:hypothetical protein